MRLLMAPFERTRKQSAPGGHYICGATSAKTRVGSVLGQVENQHFRVAALPDRQLAGLRQLERVARLQRDAVRRDCAARDMHVGASSRLDVEARLLAAVEQARVDARVLLDEHRS